MGDVNQKCRKAFVVIRTPRGLMFCGWNIWSSFSLFSSAFPARGPKTKKQIGEGYKTYGTISSLNPLKNNTGTSVILGMMFSDGQSW